MRARAGLTLAECMVALALGGLVSAAVASVLTTQGRLVRVMMTREADSDALRVTAAVLRSELRWLAPQRDVRAVAGDSIAVRLFRGTGVVCGRDGDRLLVRYRGARLPSADKDSVLVRTDSAESAHALTRIDAGALCDGQPAVGILLDPAPPVPALMAFVFESGTYYVRDRALRFRLGREGRQPLTDERFATSGPGVALDAAGAAALVPIPWPRGAGRDADSLRVHFANGRR